MGRGAEERAGEWVVGTVGSRSDQKRRDSESSDLDDVVRIRHLVAFFRSEMSAVERIRCQPGENGPGKRPGDDVAGVVNAGVDARVGDERGKTLQGYRGRRRHSTDPACKGKCGRRVARGERSRDRHPRVSRHWNMVGDAVWPSAAPEGLQAEVDDHRCHPTDASPLSAARRPRRPPATAMSAAAPSDSWE